MAIKVAAKGDGPSTGMPKSVAPTKKVIPAAPDQVTAIRAPTRAGYGMNGYEGRSSTSPGETTSSPLADNLKASTDDGEGVLDSIIKNGVKMDIDWQTRAIGDGNVPTHPNMKGAAPGPQVPAKTGAAVSQPVRKPGQ